MPRVDSPARRLFYTLLTGGPSIHPHFLFLILATLRPRRQITSSTRYLACPETSSQALLSGEPKLKHGSVGYPQYKNKPCEPQGQNQMTYDFAL